MSFPTEHLHVNAGPFGRTPAVPAACSCAVGALASLTLGTGGASPALVASVAALLLAPAAVNLVVAHGGDASRLRAHGWPVDAALLASLVLASALWTGARHELVGPRDVSLMAGSDVTVTASAVEVRRSTGGSTSVVARADSARGKAAEGRLWVTWPHDAETPERGDRLLVTGTVELPQGRRNPGGFDFASYLKSRNIGAVLRADRAHVLERRGGPGRAAAWIERTIRSRVGGVHGGLLTGLLLGRSDTMPYELVDSFRISGTVHVLAASGLHVGFLVLMVHALLRMLRLRPTAALVFTLPFLAGFVALVGPRPSIVRASVMAAALIAARLSERRVSTLNTLGVAALVLIVLRPGAVLDVGSRMSFGAVLGIVVLYAPLRARLVGGREVTHGQAARGGLRRSARLAFASSIALSVSAQVGVAPSLVSTFSRISLVSPLANIVVVPLAGFAVAAESASLCLQGAPGPGAAVFAAAAWGAAEGIMRIVALASSIPLASAAIPSRAWPLAALILPVLTLMLSRRTHRRAAGWVLAGLLAVAAAATATVGPGRSAPRMIVFDVGQGDAILLELPGEGRVLVDAGRSGSVFGESTKTGGAHRARRGMDSGLRVIVPYLRSVAASRLETIVITHGHSDHVGGVRSVLEATEVGEVLISAESDTASPLTADALSAARVRGARVSAVRAGDTLAVGDIAVLWPPGATSSARGENDRSVVLECDMNGSRILLTGDIERPTELALAERSMIPACRVLKVAHHGAATSSSDVFMTAATPALAVVSVGRGNRYGHPDADVLARLKASGAEVFRTDVDGAVVIDFVRGRIRAKGVLSEREVTLSLEE